MIDYEKLKLAHELAANYAASNWPRKMSVTIDCQGKNLQYILQIVEKEKLLFDWMFENLDNLIVQIQQSTQPQSKYKVGQEVWRLNDKYEPQSFKIADIDFDADEKYLLDDSGDWWLEEQLYSSKNGLVHAQIKYWLMQFDNTSNYYSDFEDEIKGFEHSKVCQHVPTDIKWKKFEQDGTWYECSKCGEFYQ